jgi:glycosyltransferase involved in cell wall biosynthesis
LTRILFIFPFSAHGGPTYRLLRLIAHFRRKHMVAAVVPGEGSIVQDLEQMDIPVYRTGSQGLSRRATPWLCRLIRQEGFDLVYGTSYRTGMRNALIAAKLTGRPFVWHINEMLKEVRSEHWRRALFLRFADLIIADSEACARSVRRHASGKNVQVVYNGIDPDEFELDTADAKQHVHRVLGVPAEQLVILNAGLVCPRKGQEYGVEAAVEILKEVPAVTFAFLGGLDLDPEYANGLTTRVSKRGLEDRIQFLGFRDDFASFAAGSDVFLHTAAQDPHPLVVLSAMAASLPVVAFAVDGLVEQVVDGETGYLVPFGDVEAMVVALRQCLASPSLRQRLGESGRQRVQAMFTAEEMGRRVGALVDRLLTG